MSQHRSPVPQDVDGLVYDPPESLPKPGPLKRPRIEGQNHPNLSTERPRMAELSYLTEIAPALPANASEWLGNASICGAPELTSSALFHFQHNVSDEPILTAPAAKQVEFNSQTFPREENQSSSTQIRQPTRRSRPSLQKIAPQVHLVAETLRPARPTIQKEQSTCPPTGLHRRPSLTVIPQHGEDGLRHPENQGDAFSSSFTATVAAPGRSSYTRSPSSTYLSENNDVWCLPSPFATSGGSPIQAIKKSFIPSLGGMSYISGRPASYNVGVSAPTSTTSSLVHGGVQERVPSGITGPHPSARPLTPSRLAFPVRRISPISTRNQPHESAVASLGSRQATPTLFSGVNLRTDARLSTPVAQLYPSTAGQLEVGQFTSQLTHDPSPRVLPSIIHDDNNWEGYEQERRHHQGQQLNHGHDRAQLKTLQHHVDVAPACDVHLSLQTGPLRLSKHESALSNNSSNTMQFESQPQHPSISSSPGHASVMYSSDTYAMQTRRALKVGNTEPRHASDPYEYGTFPRTELSRTEGLYQARTRQALRADQERQTAAKQVSASEFQLGGWFMPSAAGISTGSQQLKPQTGTMTMPPFPQNNAASQPVQQAYWHHEQLPQLRVICLPPPEDHPLFRCPAPPTQQPSSASTCDDRPSAPADEVIHSGLQSEQRQRATEVVIQTGVPSVHSTHREDAVLSEAKGNLADGEKYDKGVENIGDQEDYDDRRRLETGNLKAHEDENFQSSGSRRAVGDDDKQNTGTTPASVTVRSISEGPASWNSASSVHLPPSINTPSLRYTPSLPAAAMKVEIEGLPEVKLKPHKREIGAMWDSLRHIEEEDCSCDGDTSESELEWEYPSSAVFRRTPPPSVTQLREILSHTPHRYQESSQLRK